MKCYSKKGEGIVLGRIVARQTASTREGGPGDEWSELKSVGQQTI